MILNQLELLSYTGLLLGQRQLLLSLAGFVLVLLLCRLWRRHNSASVLSAWLFFLSWLVWAPLVFTPELLQGLQAPIRNSWNIVAPADVFSLCSQSVAHRFRAPLLPALPQLNGHLIIIFCWALLACWRTAQLWRRHRRFVSLARDGAPLDDSTSTALLERWRQAYRLKRQVALRSCDRGQQAFTVGWYRPIIYLPHAFVVQLSRAELDAVIGHEMAHVKRCDDLVIRLQRLLRAIFFFNPFVSLIGRQVAELREQCCDRLAIERGNLTAKHYGQSLLRTLSLNSQHKIHSHDIAGLHSTSLRRRIASLTQRKKRFSPFPLIATALLLTTLSLLLGHTGSDPVNAQDSSQALARLNAVSPVPGQPVADKPFIWPNQCVLGNIQPNHYHPGVDFATPAGQTTAIRSLAKGRVSHAFYNPRLSGWQVNIRHPHGIVSTYIHLESLSVRPGDKVSAGDVIARNSGQPHNHVHVEAHQNGRVLDTSYLLALNH